MKNPIIHIDENQQFKVLIFRNGDIGNTVVSEPFFRILKEMFPKIIIHAVLDEIGSELMRDNPYLDKIITFNKYKDSLKTKIQLIKKLRKEKFLISIHLKSGITNEQIAFFSRIPNRVGSPLKGSFQFINKVLKKENITQHTTKDVEFFLTIFEKPFKSKIPQLYSSEESTNKIEQLLQKLSVRKSEYIVLHPAGRSMKKENWSVTYYSELIKKITDNFHLPIIVIGIPSELEAIKEALGNIENLIYYFEDDIILKSELIKYSKYFLGNDSGPFHIAECWQIPSVVLYRDDEENYKRWHPLNSDKSLTIFISELKNTKNVLDKIITFLKNK